MVWPMLSGYKSQPTMGKSHAMVTGVKHKSYSKKIMASKSKAIRFGDEGSKMRRFLGQMFLRSKSLEMLRRHQHDRLGKSCPRLKVHGCGKCEGSRF